jgi:hypothetical protein
MMMRKKKMIHLQILIVVLVEVVTVMRALYQDRVLPRRIRVLNRTNKIKRDPTSQVAEETTEIDHLRKDRTIKNERICSYSIN